MVRRAAHPDFSMRDESWATPAGPIEGTIALRTAGGLKCQSHLLTCELFETNLFLKPLPVLYIVFGVYVFRKQ